MIKNNIKSEAKNILPKAITNGVKSFKANSIDTKALPQIAESNIREK